jgi:hypothetical protein
VVATLAFACNVNVVVPLDTITKAVGDVFDCLFASTGVPPLPTDAVPLNILTARLPVAAPPVWVKWLVISHVPTPSVTDGPEYHVFAEGIATSASSVPVRVSMLFCLPLNVVQSAVLNAPLLTLEAVGRLNVWVVPVELIPKSVPVVPVVNVCVAPVKPFKDVIPVAPPEPPTIRHAAPV